MNISRRVLVSILFTAIVILVGLLFWPFILNEIITPIAAVVWLLLRLFVLSIDQHYYWGAIIFIALIFIYRLLPKGPNTPSTEIYPDTNETIQTIEYWRNIFTLIEFNTQDKGTLKRELIRLVASLYASKQRASPNFLFFEALEQGEISLPADIHAFLFPPKTTPVEGSVKKLLQFVRDVPRKWRYNTKAQEKAEYFLMIDEILSFVESSLEMENDPAKYSPNEH